MTVKFTVITVVLRARARPDHRARRQLGLQGAGRHARDDARAVGDTDRRRRADVEVDVRRRLRRRQRRRSSACTSSTSPSRGSRRAARRSRRSRRSTSGRRRRSSRCSCSPASRSSPTSSTRRRTSTARASGISSGGSRCPLLVPAILVVLIFRTLDALRVFDVFYVFFGSRLDTQTMAIYTQNTIVAIGDVGLRRGHERRHLPDHRDLRRHLHDVHAGAGAMTVGRRARDEDRVADACAARRGAAHAARLDASALRRLPFYFLIALIFVYAVFPFYWAIRSAFTAQSDLFRTPVAVHPARSDARRTSGRCSRAASSCGRCSTRRSSPASVTLVVARRRLARRLRARPLPVPRPHRRRST